MQTLTVIKTIRWLDSLYGENTKRHLFSEKGDIEGVGPRELLSASLDVARVSTIIAQSTDAMEVLRAFDLEILFDYEKTQRVGLAILGAGPDSAIDIKSQLGIPWRAMVSCVDPLQALTTPEELRGEEIDPTILSLELRYEAERRPSLDDLSKATELLQELYTTLAQIYKKKDEGHLTVVKVDSGSAIKIDCKGIADVVKHVKDFLTKAWYMIRHRKAEDIMMNNTAVLSSLGVMDQITKCEESGSLNSEDAIRLRTRILKTVLELFKCGATLADIPPQETVDNKQLLQGFMPKLLEAPKDQKGRKPTKSQKTRKRTSKPTKRKAKR